MSLKHQTQPIFVSRSLISMGNLPAKNNINTDGQIHAPDRRFWDRENINYVLHIQWLYRVYVISLYFCCCDKWSKPGFFRWIFFNIFFAFQGFNLNVRWFKQLFNGSLMNMTVPAFCGYACVEIISKKNISLYQLSVNIYL